MSACRGQSTMVSMDRLAALIDGREGAADWEVRIIAAELLARRSAEEQRAGAIVVCANCGQIHRGFDHEKWTRDPQGYWWCEHCPVGTFTPW